MKHIFETLIKIGVGHSCQKIYNEIISGDYDQDFLLSSLSVNDISVTNSNDIIKLSDYVTQNNLPNIKALIAFCNLKIESVDQFDDPVNFEVFLNTSIPFCKTSQLSLIDVRDFSLQDIDFTNFNIPTDRKSNFKLIIGY